MAKIACYRQLDNSLRIKIIRQALFSIIASSFSFAVLALMAAATFFSSFYNPERGNQPRPLFHQALHVTAKCNRFAAAFVFS